MTGRRQSVIGNGRNSKKELRNSKNLYLKLDFIIKTIEIDDFSH